jgi:hypothetical protein
VAVDEAAGVGYDLSQQYLCTGNDVFETAKTDPVCVRQKVSLNFSGKLKTIEVLRRKESKQRTTDDALQTVLLVAPEIVLSAPADSFPQNTVELDINAIFATKNLTGISSNGAAVHLDIKPFELPKVTSAESLVESIASRGKPPTSRRGVVAVLANEVSNLATVSTHNGMRLAKYTPLEGLATGHYRPAIVTSTDPSSVGDVKAYAEYVFPKKWLLEYDCQTAYSKPVTDFSGAPIPPPAYFCQHWQEQGINKQCSVNYANGTTKSGLCGALWCNGTSTNNVEFYQNTIHQTINCKATVHNPLLTRRQEIEMGGWAILAVGTGGDAVQVRAPYGEAVKFDGAAIAAAINAVPPLKNSDAWYELTARRAFEGPASQPTLFWPNPYDFSVPVLNPAVLRCSINARFGGYMTGDAEVSLDCGKVDSPFGLSMGTTAILDDFGFQRGYPRDEIFAATVPEVTANNAALAINFSTTSYLLEEMAKEDPPYTTGPNVSKSLSAVEANTAAQLASGGDYVRLLNHWATTAGKANTVTKDGVVRNVPIPGEEFVKLNAVVNNLTPVLIDTAVSSGMGAPTKSLSSDSAVSAVQFTTTEKQRIAAFSNQYAMQIRIAEAYPDCPKCIENWKTDITGTPYGAILTGWQPPWFFGDSTLSLLGIKSQWETETQAVVQAFYDAYKDTKFIYSYGDLLTSLKAFTDATHAYAFTAAENASTAAPTQVQAAESLSSILVAVSNSRDQLREDIRAAVGAAVDASDDEVAVIIQNNVNNIVQTCNVAHQTGNPFFGAIIQIAKYMPYVSQAANVLGKVTKAIDKANASGKLANYLVSDGSGNFEKWLDSSKKLAELIQPLGESLKTASPIVGGLAKFADSMNRSKGKCPDGSTDMGAAKAMMMSLANTQALLRTMEAQLGTLYGTIVAIRSNAEYYVSAGASASQLADETTRVATKLSDPQLLADLRNEQWLARKQGLLVACEGAHSAIETRLPMLVQLSHSLATNAGRSVTEPGLMIPAWDSATSGVHEDEFIPIPYNLWEPGHQVTVTGREQTSTTPVAGLSFVTQASNRWKASNTQVCSTLNGVNAPRVFTVSKEIAGEELASFWAKGWAPVSVNLTDFLGASTSDTTVSPTIQIGPDGTYSRLLSAPVVWNIGIVGCIGVNPLDPCCDSTAGRDPTGGADPTRVSESCTTKLWFNTKEASPNVVRMATGWVPVRNDTCNSADSDVGVNYQGGRNSSFPVATRVCRVSVTVPPTYGGVDNIGGDVDAWAKTQSDAVCSSIDATAFKQLSMRGVPLFGEWVITDSPANASVVAHYNHLKTDEETDEPTLVPASTLLATNNASITAIRVVFSTMAEPQASNASASYEPLNATQFGMTLEE